MMKALFSVSVSVLLLCVLCSDGHPVSSPDTFREVMELLRVMTPADGAEGRDPDLLGSPDVLLSDSEDLEKRDLPRLGVSVHRASPSRVYSSKSVIAPRYRLSSPAKWMSNLQG